MVAYEYSLTKKYLVSDELLESIRNNDIQTVDRLLNTGIHPKMILHTPMLSASLLSHAAANGRLLIVRRLLEDLHRRFHHTDILDHCNGRTALHEAARIGSADVITELVNNGCDIDLADKQGNTALILAVNFGNLTAVAELLRLGAYVLTTDRLGASALHYSTYASPRLDDISRLLISAGCLSNGRTFFGVGTPLSNLLHQKNTDLVKYLIRSGYDIRNDYDVIETFICSNVDHQLTEYLMKIGHHPKSLFFLCKSTVIDRLLSVKNGNRGHLKDKIYRLPIPEIIMRDVMIA